MTGFPVTLAIAVSVQVVCQLFKLIYYSFKDHRLSLHYLVTAGGIPSAHTAFVAALSVAIGVRHGFGSDLFAVASVFSAIVIYDAYRLRGHVQTHAKLINRLLLKDQAVEPVSEMVGHSVPEIVMGLLIGGGVSAGASILFQ